MEAGATYALDWEFEDLAEQVAEIAAALWAGVPLAELPPVPPRRFRPVSNAWFMSQRRPP
ncbi:hypothetical protein JCM13664_14180 [Methylothermus subterraneus]